MFVFLSSTETPAPSAAPVKSVTRPRTDEWEYINPSRRSSHSLSQDQIYGTEMSSLSQASALSKQRRTRTQCVQFQNTVVYFTYSSFEYRFQAEY